MRRHASYCVARCRPWARRCRGSWRAANFRPRSWSAPPRWDCEVRKSLRRASNVGELKASAALRRCWRPGCARSRRSQKALRPASARADQKRLDRSAGRGNPRFSRNVFPSYSVWKRPRRWSSGTHRSFILLTRSCRGRASLLRHVARSPVSVEQNRCYPGSSPAGSSGRAFLYCRVFGRETGIQPAGVFHRAGLRPDPLARAGIS